MKVGEDVSIEYLEKAILTDLPYYNNSNGGVTFSGGEPMLQIDFLDNILDICKSHNIHTAVDTAGCVPWSYFEKIIDKTDLFLYDMKAINDITHQTLTGVKTKLILSNLTKLSNANKRIHIRIPLIIGANENEISIMAKTLSKLNIERVDLLPYHKLGNSKYDSLNYKYLGDTYKTPTENEINDALNIFKEYNINANKH